MEESSMNGMIWLLDGQKRPTIGYTDGCKKKLEDFNRDSIVKIIKKLKEFIPSGITTYYFWFNSIEWAGKNNNFHIKCNIEPDQFFKYFKDKLELDEKDLNSFYQIYPEECYSECIISIYNSNNKITNDSFS